MVLNLSILNVVFKQFDKHDIMNLYYKQIFNPTILHKYINLGYYYEISLNARSQYGIYFPTQVILNAVLFCGYNVVYINV